jgi:hypothetical protein
MGWNYGVSIPGGSPGRLAAGPTTIIAGRLLSPNSARHAEELRSELFELHNRSQPVNVLRQPSPLPATRRGLAKELTTHDTGW